MEQPQPMDDERADMNAIWEEEWRQIEYCLRNGIADIDGYLEAIHNGTATDF